MRGAMDRSALSRTANLAGAQARDAHPSLQRTAPPGQSKLAADPDDLVTRALTILGEDKVSSDHAQLIQTPNIARQSRTQSLDLKLQRRILSDGTECPLPIRYFDVQCLVATFLTDLDRAAELLKGHRSASSFAGGWKGGRAALLHRVPQYRYRPIQ